MPPPLAVLAKPPKTLLASKLLVNKRPAFGKNYLVIRCTLLLFIADY
jgi:hypothetical protein